MRKRRKALLPAEPVRVTIESLSHDGRGIAHLEGKTLFVEGGLAGEIVSAQYTQQRNRFDEARTIEVHQASPDRVEPPCAHAGVCGGCSLQHMASEAQILFKQQVLLEQLAHFGGLQPDTVLPPLTGPTLGYRHKARLGVKHVIKKGTTLIGFREKRSAFLADIERCPVLVPEVGERLLTMRELFDALDGRQRLPQVEIAQGDDITAWVVRHMDPLSESDLHALSQYAQANGVHLYLQPAGPDSVHRVWPLHGDERLTYQLPGCGPARDQTLTLAFHPLDFTQVNPAINRAMIERALTLLAPTGTDRVLDLFCGLGNFTLPLATLAGEVVGVEGEEALVVRGRENAQRNALNNVTFHGADLTQPMARQPWAHAGFERILIDPPRTGALEIVQNMTVFKPQRIVYVSCNPATLARDAGELAKQGYRLKAAGVMDMFPHTTHVESIAMFEPE